MKLALIDNWHTIAKKAWSMRLIYLSMFLTLLDQAMPSLAPASHSRVFALASLVVAFLAGVARLLPQKELTDAGEP